MTMDHPMQPVEKDEKGVQRFKANEIVRYLLDNGPFDLNDLAGMKFSQNDREQFAQLIGYSLAGFAELSYVREVTFETAVKMGSNGMSESQATIDSLQERAGQTRSALRRLVEVWFRTDGDDLLE